MVAIHADFRKEGRTFEGRIVTILHAKGGVGATSVAAALGEVCSDSRRTLLWDLDVETRDLSRALAAGGPEAKIVSGWVNGSTDINRETFRDALIPISSDVSMLTPPDRFAECMDLVCHADGMEIASRILELSRVLFDVVIVDTAGRMGPAVGEILRSSDIILLVTDASELGLTALDLLLTSVKPLIGGADRLRILINPLSEDGVQKKDVTTFFDSVHNLSDAAWSLPIIPYHRKAASWPGSGSTLCSLGMKDLAHAFNDIAAKLMLIQGAGGVDGREGDLLGDTGYEQRGWLQRILKRR